MIKIYYFHNCIEIFFAFKCLLVTIQYIQRLGCCFQGILQSLKVVSPSCMSASSARIKLFFPDCCLSKLWSIFLAAGMEKGIKYNQDQSSITLLLELDLRSLRHNAVALKVTFKRLMLTFSSRTLADMVNVKLFEWNAEKPPLFGISPGYVYCSLLGSWARH